mgnify:CR=1 FL=1
MDKLIYTVSNSMNSVQTRQAITAQNLANMNVPGYRRDLPNDNGSLRTDNGQSFAARVFQMQEDRSYYSGEVGFMDQTGDPLDISIAEEGYFYVQEGDGQVGLTRRGDLRTDGLGRLTNGANELILDVNMQPIVLPPHRSMQIDDVGQISIVPIDSQTGDPEPVNMLATVAPDPNLALTKGLDGLIRGLDGLVPLPNQLATVQQGVLEGANVNTTEELIAMIDLQRGFEMNTRMIETAKELDESGASLMRAPQE